MIQTIIVEDDPNHQRELVSHLKNSGTEFNILAITETVAESYETIQRLKPELVFLDIMLGFGDNGFDLLRRFEWPSFAVIFITSHDESSNVIQAMRACALDFLPKPVKFPELEQAISRFLRKGPSMLERTRSLAKNISSEDGRISEIWIYNAPTQSRLKVEVSNIFYCQSQTGCTHLFLIHAVEKVTQILTAIDIGDIERMLAKSRVKRTHNQYLANLDYVQQYVSGVNKAELIMKNPANENSFSRRVPVSKRRKNEIRELLGL